MHHRTNSGRVALFFEARDWSGEVVNREPGKCTRWSFTDLADPAANIVVYIAEALRRIASGEIYSEGGWSSP